MKTFLLTLLIVLSASGCTSRPQAESDTALLVVVRSDLMPPLARLELTTVRGAGRRQMVSIDLAQDSSGDGSSLPLSFVIEAQAGDLEDGVTLQVSGFDEEALDPRVRRVAHLPFKANQVMRFVVELAAACEDRFAGCEARSQTCGGDGTCIDVDVDPSALSPVAPGEELAGLNPFPTAEPEPSPSPMPPQKEPDGTVTGPTREPDGSMVDMDGGPDSMIDMDGGPDSTIDMDGGPDSMIDVDDDAGDGAAAPCTFSGERCQAGSLHVCEEGTFVESRTCPAGCYEGADRCNECVAGEARCTGDWLQSCDRGFWRSDMQCDLGCSPLALACVECIGPTERCGVHGNLESCQLDGQWAASTCYSGCIDSDGVTLSATLALDGGVPMNVIGDAAVASDPPICAPCRHSDLRCTGRDILSCDAAGNGYERGCHFGCADTRACREETALGQALLMTVL